MESINWRPRLWEDGTAGITDPYELLTYFQIINRIYLMGGPIALDIRMLSALCRQTEKRFLNSLAALIHKGKVFLEIDANAASTQREDLANAAQTKMLRRLKSARISARHCGDELERATKRISDAKERMRRHRGNQQLSSDCDAQRNKNVTRNEMRNTYPQSRVAFALRSAPQTQTQTQTQIPPLSSPPTSHRAALAAGLATNGPPAAALRDDHDRDEVASAEQWNQLSSEIARLKRGALAAATEPNPTQPEPQNGERPPAGAEDAALMKRIQMKREELSAAETTTSPQAEKVPVDNPP